MLAYIAKRLLATIPVMAIVAIFVFAMLRLTPGDPASIIAGAAATTQDVDAIRARLGLDRPLLAQFFVWIGNMATGDFGESFFFKKQVADLVADRIEPTLIVVLVRQRDGRCRPNARREHDRAGLRRSAVVSRHPKLREP